MNRLKPLVAAAALAALVIALASGMGQKSADAIPRPAPGSDDVRLELARLRAEFERQRILNASRPDYSRPDREETSSGVTVFHGTAR